MKRVVIYYKFLPHYRKEFFEGLRQKLKENGVELLLYYGKLRNNTKNDELELTWAKFEPNVFIKLGGIEFIWQNGFRNVKKNDLVIIEQANRLLTNFYFLLFKRVLGIQVAYWGHGLDMQKDRNSLKNKIKKRLVGLSDWWFPYTDGCRDYVTNAGFPIEKTTVVQNSIDTRQLQLYYKNAEQVEVDRLRQKLNISSEAKVGVFCGSIYAEKRIDFLLESAKILNAKLQNFHLIIIGSGPETHKITTFIEKNSFVHYVGNQFEQSKATYFKLSNVFMMPGLVGLAILDAFATDTPMITTSYPYHSPEIEYLINGENGVITENNLESYVDGVLGVLTNDSFSEKLVEGCQRATKQYTVETMINNFSDGIIRCLGL